MSASKPSGSETPATPRRAKVGVLGMLATADSASVPSLSQAGQDFFRTRLWSPAPVVRPPTQSFQDTVLSQAAELVGPSSSAAALAKAADEVNDEPRLSSPRPKVTRAAAAQPSGVNSPGKHARGTAASPGATPTRRGLRSQGEVFMTPLPASPRPKSPGKLSTSTPASPRAKSPGKLSPAKLTSGGAVLARQKQSAEDKISKFLSLAGVSSPSFSRASDVSSPPAKRKRKAGADSALSRSPQTAQKSRSARSRRSKSPSPMALPPSSRPKAKRSAHFKSGGDQAVVPRSPGKGSRLVMRNAGFLKSPYKGRHHELRALALTTVALEQMNSKVAGKRCRMQPLETWRNERVIYKREPGSHMPSVAAVELNLSPRPAQDPPRSLDLIALQPPPPLMTKDEPLRNLEFIGVQSKAFVSQVYNLPFRRSSPYTVALEGTGILHIFAGSLRYTSQEGAKDEGLLRKGDTMLVQGRLVVGPAGKATASNEGTLGAQFRWVKVHTDRGKPAAHRRSVEPAAIADTPAATL